jgi:type II secretory pathway component PulK
MAGARNKGVATIAAVLLVVVAAVVVATTGDSWAVRMTLSLVAVDVAVRLYRWSSASS